MFSKKIKLLLSLSLILVFVFSSQSFANESKSMYDKYKNTDRIYVLENETKANKIPQIINKKYSNLFIKGNMETILVNSRAGWEDGDIIKEYYKIDYDSRIASNVGDTINERILCSVGPGQTVKTTSSKTTSGTLSFTGSHENSIKETVKNSFGLSASGTYSYTVTKSTEFKFPDYLKGYNTCTWYLGTAFDKYKVVLRKYVDRIYSSTSIVGFRIKTEQTNTTKTIYCLVPRESIYAIGGTGY